MLEVVKLKQSHEFFTHLQNELIHEINKDLGLEGAIVMTEVLLQTRYLPVWIQDALMSARFNRTGESPRKPDDYI